MPEYTVEVIVNLPNQGYPGYTNVGAHAAIRVSSSDGDSFACGFYPKSVLNNDGIDSSLEIVVSGTNWVALAVEKDTSNFERYDRLSKTLSTEELSARYAYDFTSMSSAQYEAIRYFFNVFSLDADAGRIWYSPLQSDGINCAGFVQLALAFSGVPYYLSLQDGNIDNAWMPTSLTNTFSNTSGYGAAGFEASDNPDVLVATNNIHALTGGGGTDALYGNTEADRLDGGADVDVMRGWLGDDTYVVDNLLDLTIEAENEGLDTVIVTASTQNSSGYALALNIENGVLDEAAQGQALSGNASNNVLQANSFGSTLFGQLGDDRLLGGVGDNHLYGGQGADTLFGGSEKGAT